MTTATAEDQDDVGTFASTRAAGVSGAVPAIKALAGPAAKAAQHASSATRRNVRRSIAVIGNGTAGKSERPIAATLACGHDLVMNGAGATGQPHWQVPFGPRSRPAHSHAFHTHRLVFATVSANPALEVAATPRLQALIAGRKDGDS